MRAGAGSQESADDGASGDAAPDVDDLDWDRNALTEMDEAAAKQLEEPGPGIAKKRPTLFDELMAIDSDPAIDRTELGHLDVGAEADVAVLAVREGDFGFLDVANGRLAGDRKLECELTVRAGEVVWDLNGRAGRAWDAPSEGDR